MTLVAHKYMPGQMPTEELRATFAARQHTLDYLVSALREQAGSRTLTSYLMTGPRGSGKTTLVLMLCLRVEEDPELRAAWLPVRFPEELPAVTSLRDLLAAALQVLADDGIPGAREWCAKVESEAQERPSLDLAVAGLRAVAQSQKRRLVLFVENLEAVFERGLDEGSEATLRRLLMDEPFMLVVGTAVRVFEEVRAYDRAFFNYFCPVPLERLDDEQVYELLSRRARYDGNAEFEQRYRRDRPKVQALSRLAGGNPRLVVMLYEILGQRSIGSVIETLRQLVDELTPLLKDIVEHQLAGQQSKILDAIMRAGGTATPADVARSTRLSLNTVTTQLRRLRDAQMIEVRGGGKGRAAYYTVADPLFSVWYQMRYLRPQRRKIEMFVEVLRIWFETEERLDVLRSLMVQEVARGRATREMAVAAEYYAASLAGSPYASGAEEMAVKYWLAVGELREAALTLAEFRDQGTRDALVSEVGAYTRLGHWLQGHGELTKGVEALRAAVEREPADMGLRFEYGIALGRSGVHEAAFRVFDEVVRQTEDPNLRASALRNRGVSRSLIGDHEAAIADFTAVESAGTPTDQVASALINKGLTLDRLGRSEEAIRVYDDVLARFGGRSEAALAEQVAWALVSKGVTLGRLGRSEEAIRGYDDVLARFGDHSETALAEQVARALFNKGLTLGGLGRPEEAIRVYDDVLARFGDRSEPALAEQVVRALFSKGLTLDGLGRSEEAIGVYDDVLVRFGDRSEPALAESVARALVRRGLLKRQRGDVAGTIDDYTAALALDGISPGVRAAASLSRAAARMSQGESDQALSDWLAVISDGNASSAIRLESARAALETFWRDGVRLDQILNAMPRDLTGLDLPERAGLVRLLGSLASPGMREAWPTVWRAILRMLSPEAADQLSFFTAIAAALERHGDLSPLDPLPPEQREFAVEVLRKFEVPMPE